MSSQAEGYETVEIQMDDEVKGNLESRHILDEEVKMVIHNAETSGEKLFQPEGDRYLAKMPLSNATFYVEYSVAEGKPYIVHTAYSHRAQIEEE